MSGSGWLGMREEHDFTGASGDVSTDAFRDLISKVCVWAQLNRFDDDQDPALDSPAQGVVRALDRWQAVSAGPTVGDRAESRIEALEAGLAEAIRLVETYDYDGDVVVDGHVVDYSQAIDRLTALLDDE